MHASERLNASWHEIDHVLTAEFDARYYDANELENSNVRDLLLYSRNRAWLKEIREP